MKETYLKSVGTLCIDVFTAFFAIVGFRVTGTKDDFGIAVSAFAGAVSQSWKCMELEST